MTTKNQIIKNLFKTLLAKREIGIFIGLIVVMITFSLTSEYFFTLNNLMNITRQVSILGIISVGMTLAILSGGIDLSVGSVVAFVGVVVADLLVSFSLPIFLAIGIGILLGAIIGAINGILISVIQVPAFIATLGGLTVYRGLAYVYTQGSPVYGLPRNFGVIGGGYLGKIPVPTLIMFVIVGFGYTLLTKTSFGRTIYAIGGNEEAARLSGIPVTLNKVIVYTIVGIITSIGGIILASRLRSGLPTAGTMYELDAIAAVILGGASIKGGEGSVIGTIMGAFLLGVLQNGLNLLDVDPYILQVITGLVIVLAVVLDRINKQFDV